MLKFLALLMLMLSLIGEIRAQDLVVDDSVANPIVTVSYYPAKIVNLNGLVDHELGTFKQAYEIEVEYEGTPKRKNYFHYLTTECIYKQYELNERLYIVVIDDNTCMPATIMLKKKSSLEEDASWEQYSGVRITPKR